MATDGNVSAVLDASVLLAVLLSEVPVEALADLFQHAVLGAVNLAEVLSKASELGLSDAPELSVLLSTLQRVEPFTVEHARRAAALRLPTRKQGLSLGDRACLALALDLQADVYTADRSWANIDVGCKVHLIR